MTMKLNSPSKETLKFIKSLKLKKNRFKEQLFLVEGAKNIIELLQSDYQISLVIGTNEFLHDYAYLLPKNIDVFSAKIKDLGKTGTFKTNNSAIAVAEIKPNIPYNIKQNEFILVLDDIRDPGNLGTIIRIADWYGINKIVLSETTTDVYNPKVINSSMGSFTRVSMFQTNLKNFLDKQSMPIFGAFTDGENIHEVDFPEGGFIVLGNESKGISPELSGMIKRRISIPRYGRAESLNVATAAAVICDNLKRKT